MDLGTSPKQYIGKVLRFSNHQYLMLKLTQVVDLSYILNVWSLMSYLTYTLTLFSCSTRVECHIKGRCGNHISYVDKKMKISRRRIAMTKSAMVQLTKLWKDKSIKTSTKMHLVRSHVFFYMVPKPEQ